MSSFYQVHEIFNSIQGEGHFVGTPATFVRLQGCPVGCPWCDSGPRADAGNTNGQTRNTWGPGGTKMSVKDILNAVKFRPHVIITGGEPTIFDLDELILGIKEAHEETFVQIETSGLKWLGRRFPDWITCSPKQQLAWEVSPKISPLVHEWKFVVDEALQEGTVESFEFFGTYIYLMPEGCPPRPEMVRKTLQWLDKHPTWNFSDRLQYRLGVR